jgi:mono/diheme cytochrome c family protein
MKGMSPGEGLLVLLLLVGVLLHVGARPDYSRRNVQYMPDMADSPAYVADEANDGFPDGRTIRTPPAGTVPRGFLPLHDEAGLLDGTTAWDKLTPEGQARWDAYAPAVDPATLPEAERTVSLQRGRTVFQNVCATCHGAGGTGGAEPPKRGVPLAPSLLDPRIREMTDGHLFHVITNGKANMKPHRNHVAREDRWKVIRYLRSLQAAAP